MRTDSTTPTTFDTILSEIIQARADTSGSPLRPSSLPRWSAANEQVTGKGRGQRRNIGATALDGGQHRAMMARDELRNLWGREQLTI